MPANSAAWLKREKAPSFEVDTAPYPKPGANQLVVRNHAVAINPFDGLIQKLAVVPLKYPAILGLDLAGVVEEVGSDITRFKKGDRVVGHGVGLGVGDSAQCAFQHFTLLQANMVSPLPDDMSFERAAVLPIGLSTAASAMFQQDALKMQLPTEPRQKPAGKTILIWGGSTSVGSNAIQLAVAAGYDVVTTASPHNFDYVKKLGASQVFDHKDAKVVDNIVAALKGKTLAGALDCIAAWPQCFEILEKSEGNLMMISTVRQGELKPPSGVTAQFVFGVTLKDNEVGAAIYEDFLPKALKSGAFVPSPEPLVAGHGLEKIQDAVNLRDKGTSAQKVVVRL